MRRAISFATVLLVGMLGFAVPALAEDGILSDAFYGDFVGKTISEKERGKKERDLAISIRRIDNNRPSFSLEWTTLIPRADGSVAEKSQKIRFRLSRREHIYNAGMKPNAFGKLVALDPMKGEPYVWARVRGAQMVVYFMHVLDDGTYEMQVYDRQLTADGMLVTFTRSRNGERIRTITGKLKRQK